jgi:hypothetical protein
MSDPRLPGPLDDFLEHPPSRAEPAELRRDLLMRTTALVRRARITRRVIGALTAAAAMLLIAVTTSVLLRSGRPIDPGRDPLTGILPSTPGVQPPQSKPVPAVALEWKAFDAVPSEQAALYQKAGDRYVEDDGNLDAAVRCYGQAVRSAPNIEIDVNDNWLVMALKMDAIDRRKER